MENFCSSSDNTRRVKGFFGNGRPVRIEFLLIKGHSVISGPIEEILLLGEVYSENVKYRR